MDQDGMERYGWIALLLITLLGGLLRMAPMDECLWLDELHTSWTVLAPDGRALTQRAILGNNSTMYFRVVQLVTSVLGHSEWTLRLPSLVAGTLLIPATFVVCRFVCRAATLPSLLACLLVCFDRHHQFYACEARTYALVQLVALGHLGFFLWLITRAARTWAWMAWTLTGMVLFHLHCTTALFLFAEALAFLCMTVVRIRVRLDWRLLLIGFGVIGVSCFSNVELLGQLSERRDNWSHFIVATRQPQRMLWLFPFDVYVGWPLLCCVCAWLVQLRWVSSSESENEDSPDASRESEPLSENDAEGVELVHEGTWVVCLFCLLVPVVLAWGLTELDLARLFLRRYLIASSVILAILPALLVTRLSEGRWTRRILCVLVLLIALPRVWVRADQRVNEDWRAATPAIDTLSKTAPLFFYSGLIEADDWWDAEGVKQAYCRFPLNALYPLRSPRRVYVLPRTVERIPNAVPGVAQSNEAYLLVRGGQRRMQEVTQATQTALGPEWSAGQQTPFGRLWLIQWKRTQPATNE